MSTLPPPSGGGWRWPTLRRTDITKPGLWWPGPMVRSWGMVAVAGLLLACMLCLALLAHYSDAETLREERRQQETIANFTARTLGMRIDTYQRVLQSMGQGVHSSMLDTPYLLELLLREDAGYAGIFDALVMAGSDGNMVSYAPSQPLPTGDSALRDALRRTLGDGKPQVAQMAVEGQVPQLGLLLTVPLRQTDGVVHGALAGLVRMDLPGLMPQLRDGVSTQRWMLVDQDGLLLADSASVPSAPAASRVPQALGVTDRQWESLSSSSTANADSQLWDSLLVTRVGLPLPRWQVVAALDLSTRLLGMQRLTQGQWLAMACTILAVALALLGLLWRISRPLMGLLRHGAHSRLAVAEPDVRHMRGSAAAATTQTSASPRPEQPAAPEALVAALGQDEATHIRAHWQALELALHHHEQRSAELESLVIQLLEAMPSGTVWEQDNVLRYVSRRAASLLGRESKALQGTHVQQLLHQQSGMPQWIAQASNSMLSFGHFRGELPWRLRPGATRWLQVQGQQLQLPAQGNLWRLDDAEFLRQQRRLSRWQDAHDAATGLPNRHTLQAQMQSWCVAPQEPHQGYALLWLDVDYFTAFNATAGRAAGDEVLRQVAWLLQREQGTQGMAARVGADAFVLWLRSVEAESAVQTLAWRLCAAVQAWSPHYAGQRFVLGLSVGWLWASDVDTDAERLLRAVEAACREAKRTGQGRAVRAGQPDVSAQ